MTFKVLPVVGHSSEGEAIEVPRTKRRDRKVSTNNYYALREL